MTLDQQIHCEIGSAEHERGRFQVRPNQSRMLAFLVQSVRDRRLFPFDLALSAVPCVRYGCSAMLLCGAELGYVATGGASLDHCLGPPP
eukprot:2735608-Rhodomonas_salina.1